MRLYNAHFEHTVLRALLLLIFIFLVFSSPASAEPISFSRLSPLHGLSQVTVYSVIQDKLGRIWIATADGVDIYDGYGFKRLRHDPNNENSLSVNYTRSMLLDGNGNIWIGTLGGGLNRYNSITETVTRFTNRLPGTDVFALFEDSKGNIWIGTDKGVSVFNKKTEQFSHLQNDINNANSITEGSIRAITEDSEGQLWLGSSTSGLCRFDPLLKKCHRYQHQNDDLSSLAHNAINFIYIDRQQQVWIGTEGGGLDKLDSPESSKFEHFQKNNEAPLSINDNDVTSAVEDRLGILWFGTWDGGLNRYDPKTDQFESYMHSQANPSTISGNSVVSLFIDHSEQLWVGTYNSGVNHLPINGSSFLHYQHDPLTNNSISNNTIWSIAEDQEHDIWIGTSDGLNKLSPDSSIITNFDLTSLVPGVDGAANVKAILAKDGWLWLGLYKVGLVKLNPITNEVFVWKHSDTGSLGSNTVRLLLMDSKETLWIGTQNGLNRLNTKTGTMRHYPPLPNAENQIPHRRIRSLYEDDTGQIWVGTSAGISRYRVETDDFENFDSKTGHLSENGDDVRAIYQNDDGTFWLATSDGMNLVDFNNGLIKVLREEDGLANNTLYSLLDDERSGLWVTSNNGLSHYQSLESSFTNYSVTDGLQSNEFNFNAYLKAADGSMYIGGVNGLNHFDPENLINNLTPPKGILSVSTTNQGETHQVKQDSPVHLQNDFGRIQFDFSALHFQTPKKNWYQYRLNGYDTQWLTTPASHNQISYTSLDAGDYQLEVSFISSNGVASKEVETYSFSVLKSPWRTYPAYGLYLFIN